MVEGSPHRRRQHAPASSSSQGYPLLEDDCTQETQQFVERVERYLIEFMLEKSEKLGMDDVEESDRRFVDPFICPICLSISFRSI